MDERYDSYCAADRLFYDSLGSAVEQPTFAAAKRPVPGGWRSEPLDDWLIYAPEGGTLPQQGWKIHVSATLDNAERVLDAVWDYCVPADCPSSSCGARAPCCCATPSTPPGRPAASSSPCTPATTRSWSWSARSSTSC